MEQTIEHKKRLDEARNKDRLAENQPNKEPGQELPKPIGSQNETGRNDADTKTPAKHNEQEGKNSLENHRSKLDRIRALSKKANGQDLRKNVLNAMNLSAYIDPFNDWMFGIALALATLKDTLDYTGIDLLGIGWLVTLMVSFCIYIIVLLAGAGRKRTSTKALIKKYGTLVLGTMMEMIFGIDFLPIESLIVVITFVLTLKERMDDASAQEK